MFYGLYATILKLRIPESEEADFKVSYFLGMVGLFNSVLLIPVFVVLNYTGVEPFEWPNHQALEALILNAILGTVISDYCWAKSVTFLGPLLTTLGIALTIPVSMIVDSFYEHKTFTFMYFLGTALILGSFVGLISLDFKKS
jgi:solute carrier family 35, member F5